MEYNRMPNDFSRYLYNSRIRVSQNNMTGANDVLGTVTCQNKSM